LNNIFSQQMAAMQLLESRAAAFETQGVLIFFETQGVPWLLLDNYNNIINSTPGWGKKLKN